MNKFQKLLVTLKVAIFLWKKGFYFSENTHNDKTGLWGFYRLNWENGEWVFSNIFDIDFTEGKNSHLHAHANDTIFRLEMEENHVKSFGNISH